MDTMNNIFFFFLLYSQKWTTVFSAQGPQWISVFIETGFFQVSSCKINLHVCVVRGSEAGLVNSPSGHVQNGQPNS